jgi:hypothetical protein
LLRHGFSLVWSAWASDVAATPGDNRLVLRPPIATKDGTPITGKVAYELIVDAPRPTARFTGMLGTAYPVASEGALDAVLSERDRPDGERQPIPRAAWSFVAPGARRGCDRDHARWRIQARPDLRAHLYRARSDGGRRWNGGHPRSHVLSAQ